MTKDSSKISSISKENVKVNTKSPEKAGSNLTTSDNNSVKKRKISKLINTPSKTDTSPTNPRPTKFPRKSISQTSKLNRPRASISTNGNTSIHKPVNSTVTNTSSLSKIKNSPSITATARSRTSLMAKSSPRSSVIKTPLSKTLKSESKTNPLTVHKTPSSIKKNIVSKPSIKNTNSTDTSTKKANKLPKSKYGITLTKRPRRSGWDTKVKKKKKKKKIINLEFFQ